MLPRQQAVKLIMIHFFTSLKYCFCTIWQNAETRKSHLFHSNVVITALPEFNQSLLDSFNFVDLRLIFTLL